MRRTLRYGTVTTLLVAMTALPVCGEEALAVGGSSISTDGGISVEDMLETGYGSPIVTKRMEVEDRLTDECYNLSALVTAVAESVALTAAGVELVRQIRRESPSASPSGAEPEPLHDPSREESPDGLDGDWPGDAP